MTLEEILAEIPAYLKRWRDYPLFEDMVQVGRIWAWKAWEAAGALPEERRRRFVFKVVGRQIYRLLGSPMNPYRRRQKRGGAPPLLEVPFSRDLMRSLEGDFVPLWENRGVKRTIDPALAQRRYEPDFVPELISRIATEQEIDRLTIDPEERSAFRKILFDGWTDEEAARAFSCSRHRFCRMRRRIKAESGCYVPRGRMIGKINPRRVGNHRSWRVFASVLGKNTYFGSYQSQEEALLTLDAVLLAYHVSGQPFSLLPEACRQP